jgi:anti-sigma factor RsiW
MRPCEERAEALSAYQDGEAGPEERREVEAHLRACPACRERLDALAALRAGLRAWPDAAAAPGLSDRPLEESVRGRRLPPALWAAAACVAAIGIVALLLARGRGETTRPRAPETRPETSAPFPPPEAQGRTAGPGTGARQELALPDGASVGELRISVRRQGGR